MITRVALAGLSDVTCGGWSDVGFWAMPGGLFFQEVKGRLLGLGVAFGSGRPPIESRLDR